MFWHKHFELIDALNKLRKRVLIGGGRKCDGTAMCGAKYDKTPGFDGLILVDITLVFYFKRLAFALEVKP